MTSVTAIYYIKDLLWAVRILFLRSLIMGPLSPDIFCFDSQNFVPIFSPIISTFYSERKLKFFSRLNTFSLNSRLWFEQGHVIG